MWSSLRVFHSIVCCFALVGGLATASAQADNAGDELDRRIARLIEQLGDKEYAVRHRAQEELAKLGFSAFDALSEAEEANDIEIAAQAKYLVRLIRIDWTRDTDPTAIKQILKDYEFQNEASRLLRMKQLAELPGDEGVEWLCRLARFEQSQVLSKQAALLLLNQEQPAIAEARTKRLKLITRSLDRSSRPAARWLKTYVQSESEPEASLAEWVKLTEAEQAALEQSPQQSNSQFVMELLRRQVAVLDRLNRPDDALAVIRKMVQAERGERETLSELVEWIAKRKAWAVMDDVAQRFAANFDADALLLYTLAQARLAQKNEALAEATAKKALELNADKSSEHLVVAFRLQERGLMKWSQREYEHVIKLGPPTSDVVLRARFLLSENLHDHQEDLAAGEVIKGAVDVMDSDASVMRLVQRLNRSPEAIRSRMNFFFGSHYGRSGDRPKEVEYLEKAIGQDPSDADVLIAIYRLPGRTPEQKKKTLEQIQAAVKECRSLIEEAPEDATAYNQAAWLVANTEGDIDEAIRFSQKSIDVKREECAKAGVPCNVGGYLDTLAHCYYAKGDYANAVKNQAEAAKQEPFSQAITRQLEVFRKALAAQEAGQK